MFTSEDILELFTLESASGARQWRYFHGKNDRRFGVLEDGRDSDDCLSIVGRSIPYSQNIKASGRRLLWEYKGKIADEWIANKKREFREATKTNRQPTMEPAKNTTLVAPPQPLSPESGGKPHVCLCTLVQSPSKARRCRLRSLGYIRQGKSLLPHGYTLDVSCRNSLCVSWRHVFVRSWKSFNNALPALPAEFAVNPKAYKEAERQKDIQEIYARVTEWRSQQITDAEASANP